MTGDLLKPFDILAQYGVPAVIIGGHAVSSHGYIRATEDIDFIFLRSSDNELRLANALVSINAYWIADEIDPKTGIEKTHPVSLAYVQNTSLMMLGSDHGFLDIFDYVPGLPDVPPSAIFDSSVQFGGRTYVSLAWLRRMKQASGRPIDLIDLEKLPKT